jgi:alkylhydroperoxidase family enzyme
MPRLRQVPRAEAAPDVVRLYDVLFGERDPVAEPGTATGTPGNWWPKLRELGQARAGYARGSQFVFSQHCKACRSVGLSEEQIQALPHWPTSGAFSTLERAVLAYTDELVLAGGRVADGTFAELQAHLSDEEILELTYIVCTYELHATMCRALRLEYDDVPERVVELAAPEAGQSRDIMGDISGRRSE